MAIWSKAWIQNAPTFQSSFAYTPATSVPRWLIVCCLFSQPEQDSMPQFIALPQEMAMQFMMCILMFHGSFDKDLQSN